MFARRDRISKASRRRVVPGGSLSASRPPRRNAITGSIAAARSAALFDFFFVPPPRSDRTLKAAVREAATTCGRTSFGGASRSSAIAGAISSSSWAIRARRWLRRVSSLSTQTRSSSSTSLFSTPCMERMN